MSLAAAFSEDPSPRLSPFETVFIRTVLEHRGIGCRPTLAEFTAALDVLQRYDDQCRDNPREANAWETRLSEESQAAIRAKPGHGQKLAMPAGSQQQQVRERRGFAQPWR